MTFQAPTCIHFREYRVGVVFRREMISRISRMKKIREIIYHWIFFSRAHVHVRNDVQASKTRGEITSIHDKSCQSSCSSTRDSRIPPFKYFKKINDDVADSEVDFQTQSSSPLPNPYGQF